MIHSSMHIRPSGQVVDTAAVTQSVDTFENRADGVSLGGTRDPGRVLDPQFAQMGFDWPPEPDRQRTLVGTMLAAIGVFGTDDGYKSAVVQEINNRMARTRRHIVETDLSLTCVQWAALTASEKLQRIGTHFQSVSYLYVRPIDYTTIISVIDTRCPAPIAPPPPPPLPASSTPTPGIGTGLGYIPSSPTPSTSPSIVRVTITAPSPPLPGDLTVMLGSAPMHRVTMGLDEPDGTGTFESDPTSLSGSSTIVVLGTGVARVDQPVAVGAGTTVAPSIRLTTVCPPTPAASTFTSAADRQNWVDANPTCPAPDAWVAPPPPPPAEPPPPEHHDAPPPEPPACPTPPSFATEADRQTWIHLNATCPVPPPVPCPPPPTAWSTEAERTAWITAHATCPSPGPWCPPPPVLFESEAARQAWIEAHSSCPLPGVWSPPAAPVVVVAKKSSFWKWMGGLAVVAGSGYAYAKNKKKGKKP